MVLSVFVISVSIFMIGNSCMGAAGLFNEVDKNRDDMEKSEKYRVDVSTWIYMLSSSLKYYSDTVTKLVRTDGIRKDREVTEI